MSTPRQRVRQAPLLANGLFFLGLSFLVAALSSGETSSGGWTWVQQTAWWVGILCVGGHVLRLALAPSAPGPSAEDRAVSLPPREGSRPLTSTEGPHRQLDQRSSPELWGRMVAAVFALPRVREGHSQVSPAGSRAVLLDGLHEVTDPTASLAPQAPLEPVHLHGVTDTSLHLCLPADRAREVCEKGWGEPHGYADHATEIMVYGPRVPDELGVVLGLVRESLAFARRPRGQVQER